MSGNSKGYSYLQVTLHWAIAALVFYQLVFGEDIKRYHRALDKYLTEGGDAPSTATVIGGNLHIYIGVAILALVVIRLALRLTVGVPAAVPGPALQVKAGEALHWLFYLLLFAMPVTGLLAQYTTLPVGELHEAGQPAFIVLIVVHAGAALYHHFLLKDSTLMRMLKPGTV